MNINNFQNLINRTILDRGYNYYIGGNVDEDYVRRGNTYFFHVQGSDDCEVSVEIDDTGILSFHTYLLVRNLQILESC